MEDDGLVSGGKITGKGLEKLEPYRVKRAIFMAAGFGSRMMPITLNTPKPLVRVHGTRIIDTLLDACVRAEIEEIYIIRGYLSEQFDVLKNKYSQIRFIENPEYNTANNVVSILRVHDKLSSAYVLEADIYLKNPDLIKKYQYDSNFLGIPVKRTDDWCFSTKDGYIDNRSHGGEGDNLYLAIGISYWTEEDGKKLSENVKTVCETPGGRDKLWGYIPLDAYKNDYKVSIRTCKPEDVVEIDSFEELQEVDPAYCVSKQ